MPAPLRSCSRISTVASPGDSTPLHSFPTRRSSDLLSMTPEGARSSPTCILGCAPPAGSRRMHRRTALWTIACACMLLAACSSLGALSAWINDRVALSPSQLQRHLDQRYPRSFDKLGGLVAVTLDNPRLSIPPGDHRLRLEFDLGIGALGSRGDTSGRVALTSGLRYDAGTQGLHLDAPELLQFDIPGSGALLEGSARGVFNSLLAEI